MSIGDLQRIGFPLLTVNRYNIEAMSAFLPVDTFFSHVYLVDLSPSLCDVARQRFQRLGWKNVSVVCQDVRTFRLPESENVDPRATVSTNTGADVATMSYSLSMIPGKHIQSVYARERREVANSTQITTVSSIL